MGEKTPALQKLQAVCPTARVISARLEVVSKNVAFIPFVGNADLRSVPGCNTSWVSRVLKYRDLHVSNFLMVIGHKCTRPGRIREGQWTCQEQEMPKTDTIDMNGDLETYSGPPKRFLCKLITPQHFNVGWSATPAMFLIFRLSSHVSKEAMHIVGKTDTFPWLF